MSYFNLLIMVFSFYQLTQVDLFPDLTFLRFSSSNKTTFAKQIQPIEDDLPDIDFDLEVFFNLTNLNVSKSFSNDLVFSNKQKLTTDYSSEYRVNYNTFESKTEPSNIDDYVVDTYNAQNESSSEEDSTESFMFTKETYTLVNDLNNSVINERNVDDKIKFNSSKVLTNFTTILNKLNVVTTENDLNFLESSQFNQTDHNLHHQLVNEATSTTSSVTSNFAKNGYHFWLIFSLFLMILEFF